MWYLLLITAAAPAGLTGDDSKYGVQQTLTCTWFSNFENSRLSQCRGENGFSFASDDDASIECWQHSCSKLDAEAQRLVHGKQSDAPEGTFSIRFVGRVATQRHQRIAIGEGNRTVRIEKIIAVRKAK